jgi:metal-responsive CopG/Arc/MetJ family transcriptional regulator
MKRITISLPEELGSAVEREARRRRVPVSQVIRERLEAKWDGQKRQIPFAAIGRSGTHDTSENIDAILAREWGKRTSGARDR